MVNAGFNSPVFFTVERKSFLKDGAKTFLQKAKEEIGFPIVIKPANQGSSIGISILNSDNDIAFTEAIEKALFIKRINSADWNALDDDKKNNFIRTLADIREGIGMPATITGSKEQAKNTLYHPQDLLESINEFFKNGNDEVVIESLDAENKVLVEGFIQGKEFSCIVLQDENNTAIALPPTEIRKGKELFDYRSKYLPGLSRKITPIDIPSEQIQAIRKECERLFYALKFDVYARIDGFLSNDGKIFLNDPNTTSGMMPSSFFFAATHVLKSSFDTTSIAIGIKPWSTPQSSEHWP